LGGQVRAGKVVFGMKRGSSCLETNKKVTSTLFVESKAKEHVVGLVVEAWHRCNREESKEKHGFVESKQMSFSSKGTAAKPKQQKGSKVWAF